MARKSEEMKTKARIAIVGAGKIGRVHMAHAAREGELAGVADPSADGRQAAEAFGVPCFDSPEEMLDRLRPDGVVLATPNRLHAPQALACIAARVPVLVEKPLADTAEAAREVVVAARTAGVALLVGHHRRHNPLIAAARAEIERVPSAGWSRSTRSAGSASRTAISRYPGAPSRRGADPHQPDPRHRSASPPVRRRRQRAGALLLAGARSCGGGHGGRAPALCQWRAGHDDRFRCGRRALELELTAGENPDYPETSASCYTIGGTAGSLSLPDLGLWHYEGAADWAQPISRKVLTGRAATPSRCRCAISARLRSAGPCRSSPARRALRRSTCSPPSAGQPRPAARSRLPRR